MASDDVKIRITADNKNAIDNIEQLSKTFDNKLVPSVTKSSNALRKAIEDNEDVAKSTTKYIDSVKAAAESFIAFAEDSKGYAKAMDVVKKATKDALGAGFGKETFTELSKTLEEYKKRYQEIVKLETKDADSQKLIAEWVEAKKQHEEETKQILEEQQKLESEWLSTKQAHLAEVAEAERKVIEENAEAERKALEDRKALESEWLSAKAAHQAELNAQDIAAAEEKDRIQESINAKENEFWAVFEDTGLKTEAAEEKSLQNQIAQREQLLATQQKLYDTLKATYDQESRTQALSSLNAPSIYGTKASKNKETLIGSILGEKASTSFLGFGTKLVSTIKNIMTFRAVMTFTNKIVRGFNQLMSDSTKAAAEAEQIYSKLTTVFGEYAGAMEKASELSQKIGVSATTAASALSTVGDLLQAQGASTSDSLQLATEWVEQFQDIIAFKDIDMSLDEFAQNFMSGAAGNLRNFRTFGSIVKESAVNARLAVKGLDQLTGSELELAKMTARAEIALEQQKNAIGATSREWDTMLSVQRRYEEATKTFKENIGETLQPVTSGWTKLKTAIVEAMNQYVAAEKAMSDQDSASTPVLSLNYGGSTAYNQKNVKGMLNQLMGLRSGEVEKIRAVINQYGATEKDLEYAFSNFTTAFSDDDFYDVAKGIAAANDEQKKLKELTEESGKKFTALVESTDKLFENMQSIEGVNFVGSKWYKSIQRMFTNKSEIGEDADLDLTDSLTRGVTEAIEEALSDISKISLSEFDKLFGDEDEGDILSKRIEAYKLLYKTVMNNAYATEEEKQKVVDTWKTATEELENYNKQLELTKSVKNQIESGFDGGAANNLRDSKRVDIYKDMGMSEDYAKAYVSALGVYETTLDQAKQIEDVDERFKAIDAINTKWVEDAKAIKDYYDKIAADAEKTTKIEKNRTLTNRKQQTIDYSKQVIDYQTQIRNLGKSEYEIQIEEYEKKLAEALAVGDNTLWWAVYNAKLGFEELTKKTKELEEAEEAKRKQQELAGSFTSAGGDFGSLIDTFSGDAFSSAMSETASAVSEMGAMAGPMGYLVTEVTKIISSLDVVNQLMSLLSDSITPVLNDFLEPLLPVIATLSHALSKLIEMHLVPLYPRIQEISKALLFVVGCIDILISAVDDGMKWIIGNVQKAFYDLVNGIIDIVNKVPFVDIGHVSNGNAEDWSSIDVLGNIQDNWDELMTEIQAINDNTFGTWENTKSDVDFSKLDELLAAGLISEDQYNQRAKAKQAGLNWDTVGASMSGYVSANNHTTQVQAGAVSITINGANDSTEVQRQVYRALQDAGIAVAGQAI